MLSVFPDPRADVQVILTAAKPTRWPTAVIDTAFPGEKRAETLGVAWPLAVPWIQHAWDGTPGQQANRQTAAIRVTCWQPKGQTSDAIELAQLVLAVLLDTGSAATWRFRPGAGPAFDVDDDTGLPFCTFTVNAETRPTAVA